MWNDFKAFVNQGNVMSLAVGVIIGGAFGKIVDSVVNDLMMPLIGKVVGGGADFSNMYLGLNNQAAGLALADAKKLGGVFAYGNFITILINFLILAFCVFMMVRWVSSIMPKPAPAPPPGPSEVDLLKEIRDALVTRKGAGA